VSFVPSGEYDCFAASVASSETNGHNEDAVLVDLEAGVFVVCDGLGGLPGAADSSRLAAETFCAHIRSARARRGVSIDDLVEGMAAADQAVRRLGEGDPSKRGCATTLSAVVATGNRILFVHIGDGRIYMVGPDAFAQVTRDHTLVAELIERGHIGRDAAGRHPLRHVVTQAIGGAARLEPDVGEQVLEPGHWCILTTDGFSKRVDESQLERLCRAEGGGSAEQLCRSLIRVAAADSLDDVTVAVVGLMSDGLACHQP
jgi:protein phosphatase